MKEWKIFVSDLPKRVQSGEDDSLLFRVGERVYITIPFVLRVGRYLGIFFDSFARWHFILVWMIPGGLKGKVGVYLDKVWRYEAFG